MSIAEAVAIVARLTYKPGWKLHAQIIKETDRMVFHAGKVEPDAEGVNSPSDVSYASVLTAEALARMDERGFLAWIFDVVSQRELHEVEEWLRLEGRPLREPHPERYRRGILGDGTSLLQPPVDRS